MESKQRRRLLGGLGSLALGLASHATLAQGITAAAAGGDDSLARLQAAKKVRVGIAVDFPFSALSPDGSLSGVAPTVTQTIMKRLGVPEMEGFIATYGELVPGLMAGRWDFISAAMTISQARCAQVSYAEPIVFGGDVIVALGNYAGPMPQRLADLAKGGFTVAVQAGGVDLKTALGAGIAADKLRQLPSEQAELDALLAKRVDFAIMSPNPVATLSKQRNLTLRTTYPVLDTPPRGASCAFRRQDVSLLTAYNKTLATMKASGELEAILKQYGFSTPPEMRGYTTAQLCAKG